jgi:hypothetical protein
VVLARFGGQVAETHTKFFKKVIAREVFVAMFRVPLFGSGEFLTINRQLFFVWLDNVFVFG